MGALTVGEHTYGHVTRRGDMNTVTIGKYCSIATNVVVDSGFNHNAEWLSTYPFNSQKGWPVPHNATCKGDVIIGNDVWIGENVYIMSGVTIGDGAIIGANSTVTKNVEAYTIVGGIPAKPIKRRFPVGYANILEQMQWWCWPEENVKEAAQYLMSSDINGLINYCKTNIK